MLGLEIYKQTNIKIKIFFREIVKIVFGQNSAARLSKTRPTFSIKEKEAFVIISV